MKTNILYVGLFILAVVIIFVMAFGNSKAPEVSSPPTALKESQIEYRPAATESSSIATPAPVVFSQQAITVIKPAQKIDPVISNEDVSISKNRQSSYDNLGYSSSASRSAEIQDEEEVTAGVTRIGKYPTKEEVKEMNSKGIVSY